MFEAKLQDVLDMIRARGPVCSADVSDGEARGSGGWWDWHPSKTALEFLWRSGALAVVGREGFRKYYDLTERVLDQVQIGNAPDVEETIDWCCREALMRLGFATPGELACVFGTLGTSFALPGIADDPSITVVPTARLWVLSPFDPALRDRARAERLFGFDYRIEVFVPEAKRTYGYYVFPLLEGDRLVGRIDMKAFRDADTLRVRALWPERKVRWGKGRVRTLEGELERLKRLAGVSRVMFEDGWLRDPV